MTLPPAAPTKRYKILWIEDGAHGELGELTAAIYTAPRRYRLKAVQDVSEGIDRILSEEYDVIVTDVRFKDDTDVRWRDLISPPRGTKRHLDLGDKLGLQLLYSFFGADDEKPIRLERPAWLTPRHFAVFSVEDYKMIELHLTKLGIMHFQQKTLLSPFTLLNLIEEVLRGQGKV